MARPDGAYQVPIRKYRILVSGVEDLGQSRLKEKDKKHLSLNFE